MHINFMGHRVGIYRLRSMYAVSPDEPDDELAETYSHVCDARAWALAGAGVVRGVFPPTADNGRYWLLVAVDTVVVSVEAAPGDPTADEDGMVAAPPPTQPLLRGLHTFVVDTDDRSVLLGLDEDPHGI